MKILSLANHRQKQQMANDPKIERILTELVDLREELDELKRQHYRVLRLLLKIQPESPPNP